MIQFYYETSNRSFEYFPEFSTVVMLVNYERPMKSGDYYYTGILLLVLILIASTITLIQDKIILICW